MSRSVQITAEQFDQLTNNDNGAFPTSRLLDCDTEFSWAKEEWVERGTIDGRKINIYYLFGDDDISEDVNQYPWDYEHIGYTEWVDEI